MPFGPSRGGAESRAKRATGRETRGSHRGGDSVSSPGPENRRSEFGTARSFHCHDLNLGTSPTAYVKRGRGLAEKTMPPAKVARPDVRAYLRIMTAVWTGAFVVKATYVGYAFDVDRAVAIRATTGPVSVAALLLGERLG